MEGRAERRRGRAALAAVGAAGVLLAGCGGGSGGAPVGAGAPGTHSPGTAPSGTGHGSGPTGTAGTPSTTVRPKVLTVAEGAAQAGWTVVAATGPRVRIDERTVTLPDGDVVTLLRFRAHAVRFALHVGSSDPPTEGAAIPASAGSAVDPAQRASLLAAFNGGFKVATGAGGMEVEGQVLSPLLAGDATLVVAPDGSARIGVWGAGTPRPGETVRNARQNLPPLILHGVASPTVGDIAAWGAVLGVDDTARSALGQDRVGDLVYAGSMRAYPADMADALLAVGARTAMQLDINPYWIGAEVASHRGGPLTTVVPGQYRPADQYLLGWERDFVSVQAP